VVIVVLVLEGRKVNTGQIGVVSVISNSAQIARAVPAAA
jgi:hypothetical protein